MGRGEGSAQTGSRGLPQAHTQKSARTNVQGAHGDAVVGVVALQLGIVEGDVLGGGCTAGAHVDKVVEDPLQCKHGRDGEEAKLVGKRQHAYGVEDNTAKADNNDDKGGVRVARGHLHAQTDLLHGDGWW